MSHRSDHKHKWILIRQETRQQNGRTVIYKFFECAICSEPKMEIERPSDQDVKGNYK